MSRRNSYLSFWWRPEFLALSAQRLWSTLSSIARCTSTYNEVIHSCTFAWSWGGDGGIFWQSTSINATGVVETSYVIPKVLGLLDQLSKAVSTSFFFQNIWLVMLTTPSARGTSLNFLSRRLPRLDADEGIQKLPELRYLVKWSTFQISRKLSAKTSG